MNKLFILFLIFFVCSCATRRGKYPATYIKSNVAVVNDRVNNNIYVTTNYSNVQQQYVNWAQDGRINRDKRVSCFDSDESVNYISIVDDSISALRTYAAEQIFSSKYKLTNSSVNGVYGNISIEERVSNLKVHRKECFKRIDGYPHLVTSEIYK